MDLLLGRDVERVRHLFGGEHLEFVLDAIIAGNTPARVWTDDAAAPGSTLIWDGAHTAYLTGPVDRPERWRRLFDREIGSARPGLVKLYIPDSALRTVFAGCPLHRRERVLYHFARQAVPEQRQRLPGGFRISAINERFAELSALEHFSDLVAEIGSCWHSVGDFRRNGFGYAAHDATTIACWCTAEYVSDRRCGTGIETVAAYRGRGLATLTAGAFVADGIQRGFTPYWDAWADNLASIAVAEKVGFDRATSYSIFVGDFS